MMPLVRNHQLTSLLISCLDAYVPWIAFGPASFHDSISPSCAVNAFNRFHVPDFIKNGAIEESQFPCHSCVPLLSCRTDVDTSVKSFFDR